MKNISLVLLIVALAGTSGGRAADIIGTITLNGTPPPEVPYTPLMNDSTCAAMYTNTPTTHFYVVGPNHGLGDVVVYLKNVTSKSTGANQPPVVMDQKGCLYQPQILAIQTGQKLVVKNSDSCLHNVHTVSKVIGHTPDGQEITINPDHNDAQMSGGTT